MCRNVNEYIASFFYLNKILLGKKKKKKEAVLNCMLSNADDLHSSTKFLFKNIKTGIKQFVD